MVSEPQRGVMTHPEGVYLREGGRTGKLYRSEKGQIGNLRGQIESAGGLPVVVDGFDPMRDALDSGVYVTFRPSGKTDKLGIPYATDLVLSR